MGLTQYKLHSTHRKLKPEMGNEWQLPSTAVRTGAEGEVFLPGVIGASAEAQRPRTGLCLRAERHWQCFRACEMLELPFPSCYFATIPFFHNKISEWKEPI